MASIHRPQDTLPSPARAGIEPSPFEPDFAPKAQHASSVTSYPAGWLPRTPRPKGHSGVREVAKQLEAQAVRFDDEEVREVAKQFEVQAVRFEDEEVREVAKHLLCKPCAPKMSTIERFTPRVHGLESHGNVVESDQCYR